jgi:O-methyltransferase involved in polyketide biosynthesis
MTSLTSSSFDLIGFTALMAAYNRQFCGIPYASELAQLVSENTLLKKPSNNELKSVVPLLEIRHRAINYLVDKFGYKQIIELASGLGSRGLEMSECQDIIFVESDLPTVIELKKQLVTQLVEQRNNLRFEAIDVTIKPNQLPLQANYLCDSEKVTILCEGFLMYLTFPEKKLLCTNIRETLLHYGGVWITPDMMTKSQWYRMQETKPEIKNMFQTVSDITGRSLIDNSFNDIEHAKQFFREQGFKVQALDMAEIVNEEEVSCQKNLGLDFNFIKYLLSTNSMFVLTLEP